MASSEILKDNILERHRREFLSEGIDLEVSEEAVHTLVDMAVKSRTGARGLEKVISSRLEEVSFHSFGMREVRHIRLQWLDGDLRAEAA